MMENLPPRLDLRARKGATLGPIEVTVSGVDLTLYNLTASHALALQVTSPGTFTMAWPAALLDTLAFGAYPGFGAGNSPYWIDGLLKTDPTVVLPLLAGKINVSAKGSHDA